MEKYTILVFIALQVAYSIYAFLQLRKLSALVPPQGAFGVGDGGQVLAKAERDGLPEAAYDGETKSFKPISSNPTEEPISDAELAPLFAQITYGQTISAEFREIVFKLNEYTLKNRGSASDFAIVKDVVDRPVDAEIEHAEARTSTPLYLGLAGALSGIVAGLYKMSGSIGLQSSLSDADGAAGAMDALTGNLGELLGAVSLAMWASLIGVILTLALSLGTRKAVAIVDKHRNAFFTFYQIEFLPRITRDVSSVLSSLNGTLDRFNTQFGGNVEAMRSSFADNRTAIQEQQVILDKMRQLSIDGALGGTIKLYKQITEGTEALEKLTPHIERVHYMARQVGESGTIIAGIAGDTERVAKIAEDLTEVTRISHENQRYVNSQMESLQSASGEALSVTQQIVQSFDRNQQALQDRLADLTQELNGVIQALHQTTDQVVTEATDAIGIIPNRIEPMMREAFDAGTVKQVSHSVERAATAAREAQQELAQSKLLRGEVETGIKAQAQTLKQITSVLNSLQRRNDANAEAVYNLLERRPWWWMLPSKRKALPPELPNRES